MTEIQHYNLIAKNDRLVLFSLHMRHQEFIFYIAILTNGQCPNTPIESLFMTVIRLGLVHIL